jgi:hypothetical protein
MREDDLVLLQRYLDGTLDARESERVRMHIANSPDWQRAEEELLDDIAHVSVMLAQVDGPRMATKFDELPSVFDHAQEKPLTPSRSIPATRPSSTRNWLRAAALMIAVGGGSAVALSRSGKAITSETLASGVLSSAKPDAPMDRSETGKRPAGPKDKLPRARSLARDYRIAGATLTSTRTDTIANIVVKVLAFEVSTVGEVILEVTDAQRSTTRGGGTGLTVSDPAGTFTVEGNRGSLVWVDASSEQTLRLTGRNDEGALRAVKQRIGFSHR